MRRRLWTAAGLLIALLACSVLSGCGGKDPALGVLKDDPMATLVPAGTSLVRESSQKGGTTLGKPVHAQVTRRFSLDETTAEEALADARQAAIDAGWETVNADITPEDSYDARKEVDGIETRLLVTSGSIGGTTQLFVYLTRR